MLFGRSQNIKFETGVGTYSVVTDREHKDSQITATDHEAALLIEFFGLENIQRGNVSSNPEKAKQKFKRYPDGSEILLNLVFPKVEKKELRLYLAEGAGFKPFGLDIWFMFKRESELWIGAMDETSWRNQNRILVYDESEGTYQDSLQELDNIKMDKLKARDIYRRDRTIAIERMALANYQCEGDSQHKLFLSHSTKKPYLEAHHLIPMGLQSNVQSALDTSENIYCLCPSCHRAIHYAEKSVSKNIIDSLVGKRPEVLKTFKINIGDIYNYYAVENIVD
jgi:5-methylcytosine-specific restriction protein A